MKLLLAKRLTKWTTIGLFALSIFIFSIIIVQQFYKTKPLAVSKQDAERISIANVMKQNSTFGSFSNMTAHADLIHALSHGNWYLTDPQSLGDYTLYNNPKDVIISDSTYLWHVQVYSDSGSKHYWFFLIDSSNGKIINVE